MEEELEIKHTQKNQEGSEVARLSREITRYREQLDQTRANEADLSAKLA